MGSEVLQFLMVILGFFIVAVVWMFVIYLPGRTLERWEDQRPGRGKKKSAAPAAPVGPGGPLKPDS